MSNPATGPRVLMVSPSSNRRGCGIGDHARLLSEALSEMGVLVTLATDGDQGATRTKRANFKRHGFADFLAVSSWAREQGIDLVHVHYQTLLYSGRSAVLLGPGLFFRAMPTVVTAHDLFPPYMFRGARWPRRLLMRVFFRAAAATIVTSRNLAAEAVACGARLSRVHVLPLPSNVPVRNLEHRGGETLQRRLSAEPEDRVLLATFGAVRLAGGIDLLLQGVAALPADIRERMLLFIAGGAPRYLTSAADEASKIRRFIEDLGVANCVELTGFLEDSDLSALLGRVQAVVLPRPQSYSPSSTSAAAAIDHLKPVLAIGRKDEADDALPQGGVIWIRPQIEAVTAALRDFVEGNTSLASGWQDRFRDHSETTGWARTAERHLSLYRQVLAHRLER